MGWGGGYLLSTRGHWLSGTSSIATMSYPKLTQMMEFVTPGAPLVHNTHAPPMVGTGARNGVYDLSDEEPYTLRHCARCQRYYTIRDTDGCYFHPGKFVPPQTKRAVEIGWTCCAKLQPFGSPAFDANSKGCQFSVDHMEDLSFTKAIQAFPFHHKEFQKHRLNYLEQRMQDQRMNVTPLPPEKDDAPKKSKAKSEDLSSNPNYLAHPVSPADTLFGIALKYGMEVSDVKRINKLVGNDVIGRKVLYIPKSADALA